MHEVSIVEELVQAVQRELSTRPNTRARVVRIQAGVLRQVEPAMLEFCYRAAVIGTTLEGSRVEVEPVKAVARCGDCQLEFAVEQNWFECPRCHSTRAQVLRGDELQLTSIEIEEVPSQEKETHHPHDEYLRNGQW